MEMENNTVVISICFNDGDNFIDHFQLPYNVGWPDLEAMLSAQFDCDRVGVSYIDMDNDEVSINSEEELREAFRVARLCGNTLQLKVMSLAPGSAVFRMPDGEEEEEEEEETSLRDSTPEQAPPTQAPPTCPDETEAEPLDLRDICQPDTAIPLEAPEPSVTSPAGPPAPIQTEPSTERAGYTAIPGSAPENPDQDQMEGGDIENGDRSSGTDDNSPDTSEQILPYSDFVYFMTKLKKELRTEIVRDVTRKTVKQVLKGLDGAVIESLHGTSGQDPRATCSSQPSGHPIYVHEGVICDRCNMTIVGARYKCGNCLDFDLCEDCEAQPQIHPADHVFVKLRRPIRCVGLEGKVTKPLLKRILYPPFHRTEVVPPARPQTEPGDNEINTKLESKLKDRMVRIVEKQKRKEDKKMEKMRKKEEKVEQKIERLRRKEEKLKRRMDSQAESPYKRERLDHYGSATTTRYDFYRVMMSSRFLYDITIPDDTTVQPGTRLLKSWLMKNDGDGAWSDSTKLRLMWGDIPAERDEVDVPHLQPGEEGTVSVELTAPTEPGSYTSHWQLWEHDMKFGHRVWCTITVQPREVLEPIGPESLKVVPAEEGKEEQEETELVKTVEDVVILTRSKEPEEHLTEVHVEKRSEEKPTVVCEDVEKEAVAVTLKSLEKEGYVLYTQAGERASEVEHESISKEEVPPTGKTPPTVLAPPTKEAPPTEQCLSSSGLEMDLTTAVAQLTLSGEGTPVGKKSSEVDDLLTFEILERNRNLPLFSQTATPNNTPLDVSPPKSPAPEVVEQVEQVAVSAVAGVSTISSSSSVELLSPDHLEAELEEAESGANLQLVQERMANLGLKPDIDLESISSDDDEEEEEGEEDLETDSSLSDGDYIIVPLPDCFNINKPLTRSLTSSVSSESPRRSVDDNHNNLTTVDDILTTSGTLETPPLSPAQSHQATPPPQTLAEGRASPVMYQQGGATEMSQTDKQEVTETQGGATEATPSVTIVVDELDQPGAVSSSSATSQDTTPDPGESTAAGAASAAGFDDVPASTQGEEEKNTEQNPDDGQNLNWEETERKEPLVGGAGQDNVCFVRLPKKGAESHRMSEFASQLIGSAVNVATKAAGQAYVTGKAVIQTWQGKQGETTSATKSDEFKPKTSNWKPTNKPWTPKQSDFKVPTSNYKPPTSDYKTPQSDFKIPDPSAATAPKVSSGSSSKEKGPMGKLLEMGFGNREENQKLLDKYDNDLQPVVQELLARAESDWPQKRH